MWISRNLKKGSIWEKRNGGFFTFLCITGSFSDTLLCTEWFVQLGFCVREGTTFFGVRLSSFFFFFALYFVFFFLLVCLLSLNPEVYSAMALLPRPGHSG